MTLTRTCFALGICLSALGCLPDVHAQQPIPPTTPPSPPPIIEGEQWHLPNIGARAPSLDLLPGEQADISRSIGDVSSGFLVNGQSLALPHPYLAILDVQSRRHLTYGTNQMMALIQRAAAHVNQRHSGAVTYLGNIGRVGGGDIRWSVSHNSGRDADLAFFVVDANGQPAVMPDLLALDEDGRYEGEHGIFVFDVPRNWSLVEGLIRHGGDQLQYIFVANWLRDKLLLYGRASGASAETLQRAGLLLQQPRATLPHNDHFHIRLFCAPTDVEVGCKNSGRTQPWLNQHGAVRQRALTRAKQALSAQDADIRLAGVRRVALLKDRSSTKAISAKLTDTDPRVRAAAARALAVLGRGDKALAKRVKVETHPQVVLEMMEALKQLKSTTSTRALIAMLEQGKPLTLNDGDLRIDTRILAAQSLGWTESKLPVQPLIKALASEEEPLRLAAVDALRLLTNHQFYKRWSKAHRSKRAKKKLASAIESWQVWYDANKKKRRRQWVLMGFQQAGFKVNKLNKKDVWVLCRAIDPVAHTTYNAQRVLMRLSGHNARSLRWRYEDANYYWRRWFERRQRKFRLPRIPPDLSTKDGYQKYLKEQEQKRKAKASPAVSIRRTKRKSFSSRGGKKRARGGRRRN